MSWWLFWVYICTEFLKRLKVSFFGVFIIKIKSTSNLVYSVIFVTAQWILLSCQIIKINLFNINSNQLSVYLFCNAHIFHISFVSISYYFTASVINMTPCALKKSHYLVGFWKKPVKSNVFIETLQKYRFRFLNLNNNNWSLNYNILKKFVVLFWSRVNTNLHLIYHHISSFLRASSNVDM